MKAQDSLKVVAEENTQQGMISTQQPAATMSRYVGQDGKPLPAGTVVLHRDDVPADEYRAITTIVEIKGVPVPLTIETAAYKRELLRTFRRGCHDLMFPPKK